MLHNPKSLIDTPPTKRRPPPISQRELDREDDSQTRLLAFVRARLEWKPELGLRFKDFLAMMTHTELRAQRRENLRSKPKHGKLILMSDLRHEVEDPNAAFDEAAGLASRLNDAMLLLSRQERRVISMIFVLGMGRDEIAKMLGKSIASVDMTRKKAIAKLRTTPLPDC